MSAQLVPTGPLVRAPASSANLGPGFDTLGLALDLPFEVALAGRAAAGDQTANGPVSDDRPFLVAEPTHPVTVAFRRAGGSGDSTLLWRSPIPPGRGLGFSGAARVAGAYLGSVTSGADHDEARRVAFSVAAGLEGHGDNAAASTYGGLCVAGGFGAVRVPVAERTMAELAVLTWSPERTTSTVSARSRMPDQVPLSVAVGSIERTALWVTAMADGRTDLLREACVDLIHQPKRLGDVPTSAAVLAHLLDDDRVLAAWLSGSGPSIAALVPTGEAGAIVETLESQPFDGMVRLLGIDPNGVGVVTTPS